MGNNNILLSHSAVYAVGNIAQKIVSIIMLPIYTQLLSPADYGVVGLLTFVLSLAEIVLGAQLVQAVPKYFHDQTTLQKKNAVVFSGLAITFSATFIVTCVLFLLREQTSTAIFDSNEFSLVVGLFSVLVVNQAIQQHGLTFIRLQEKPWLFTGISLFKLCVQLSLNIYFVVIEKQGVLGVAISAAISSTLFAAILFTYTIFKTGVHFDKALAKKMFKYCWPLWIGSLAALYYGSSNRYFMSEFSSLTDIGFFELAAKLTMVMSILIWQPFSQVWQSERFKIYKTHTARQSYHKVFTYLSAILLLAALGTSLAAYPVIYIMASPEFLPASKIVPILALATVLSAFNAFFNFSFHATENTKIISRNNYLSAAFITIPLLLLVPKFGYIGAAYAALVGGLFQLALTTFSGKKRYDMGVSWGYFIVILFVCLAAFAIDQLLLQALTLGLSIALKALLLITTALITLAVIRKNHAIHEETNDMLNKLLKRAKK